VAAGEPSGLRRSAYQGRACFARCVAVPGARCQRRATLRGWCASVTPNCSSCFPAVAAMVGVREIDHASHGARLLRGTISARLPAVSVVSSPGRGTRT
jgi:hypothetical protein